MVGSMLVGDVCRWVLIFFVFVMAFSLGSYVALIMSTKSITGKGNLISFFFCFENSLGRADRLWWL